MALASQVIPCGAANLGGGYTGLNDGWSFRYPRVGGTFRVALLGTVSGNNMAVSYNGSSCNLSCDAWYAPPTHDYVIPASATRFTVAGRNSGGNLMFTNYQVSNLGDDENYPTVQVVTSLASIGAVAIAAPAPGNLLVATVFAYEQGAGTGIRATIDTPIGWTPISAQHGVQNGITVGSWMRTFYRVATGAETSFTPAGGTYAGKDSVLIREYGGFISPRFIGVDIDGNFGNDAIAGIPPTGALCSVLSIAFGGGAPTISAANPGPWDGDYYSPTLGSIRGIGGRDIAPAAYSMSLIDMGGGDSWATDIAYFDNAPPASAAGFLPLWERP